MIAGGSRQGLRFPPLRRFLPALVLAVVCPALAAGEPAGAQDFSSPPPGTDRVLHFGLPGVSAMLVLPAEAAPCRGLIVHVANMKREPSRRWTEIARPLRFGHLVMAIDMKQSNRPRRLREALDPLLEIAAAEFGRPELKGVPVAVTGHSAGGMGLPAFLPLQGRLITAAIDCSWVHDYAKEPAAKEIPLLFVIGSIPDDFKMIPAIAERYDPARREGAPASLGFEWGKAHAFGNAGTLFAAWFPAVAALRLPPEPGGALRPIEVGDEWLGDRSTWETHDARIAPAADYPGDRGAAVWLPDRAFAHVWRAFQSKSPPFQLAARTTDGAVQLDPFRPAVPHELFVPEGAGLVLGIRRSEGAPPDAEPAAGSRVRFFAAGRPLGESASAPWEATAVLPAGAHVVYAEIESAGGGRVVTNPALIVVSPARTQRIRQVPGPDAAPSPPPSVP